MRQPLVLGFLGRAGVGKTYAAKFLARNHDATIYSFARPLKLMARDVFNFNERQLFGDLKEDVDPWTNMIPRIALQRLGLAARTHLGENVWVDATIKAIQKERAQFAVIDDVRFVNEAEALVNATGFQGVVIKLTCPISTSDPKFADHPSEAQVDAVPGEFIFSHFTNKKDEMLHHYLDGMMKVLK